MTDILIANQRGVPQHQSDDIDHLPMSFPKVKEAWNDEPCWRLWESWAEDTWGRLRRVQFVGVIRESVFDARPIPRYVFGRFIGAPGEWQGYGNIIVPSEISYPNGRVELMLTVGEAMEEADGSRAMVSPNHAETVAGYEPTDMHTELMEMLESRWEASKGRKL